MAYKARRSGRMSTPMNQQAYYSTHGFDQTYGTSEGYDQSYGGDYSYDPNYAYYDNTMPQYNHELSIVLQPQAVTGKGKILSPPLVVSAVNYDPNKVYMLSVTAYERDGRQLPFNDVNSDEYWLHGGLSSTAFEAPTADGTKKLFGGFWNLQAGTARHLKLVVSLQCEDGDWFPTVAQTEFYIECRHELMTKIAMTFPEQRKLLNELGVPYLEKDDKEKDGYKWAK
ncbi:hypothetical protein G7054_g8732 [Neopestalotiopsis clavispora]|nr:hypothetical protein G7054_g8732 [Neopestalotiopsis clavispora]